MSRTLRRALTSADVRDAAEAGRLDVPVAPGVRVTPLARDTARELGLSLVPAPAAAPPGSGGTDPPRPVGSRPTVRHVDGRQVQLAPFPYPGPQPGQEVRVGDVVTAADGAPMAAGYLTLTRGSFPWTLTYDEVEYVIEGELHIGLPSGPVVGRPGDVIFIPKGTSITFGTPSWAKFLYVTYPANWEEGL